MICWNIALWSDIPIPMTMLNQSECIISVVMLYWRILRYDIDSKNVHCFKKRYLGSMAGLLFHQSWVNVSMHGRSYQQQPRKDFEFKSCITRKFSSEVLWVRYNDDGDDIEICSGGGQRWVSRKWKDEIKNRWKILKVHIETLLPPFTIFGIQNWIFFVF